MQEHRNIPAYAGKTAKPACPLPAWPEHPRVCGENARLEADKQMYDGTSPRMRGKPAPIPTRGPIRRNIPAYAGKTTGFLPYLFFAAEHPRVCGENLVMAFLTAVTNGTSPRMRGKPGYGVFDGSDKRNIPAYAGKTWLWRF